MSDKPRVLFLCTGNSARSILGEYLLQARGGNRYEAVSAGAAPKEHPHPVTLRVLKNEYSLDATTARSKSWEEFNDGSVDLVITVCDNARESCPIWPGQPFITHWSSEDPAAFQGSDEETYACFLRVAQQIERRVERFLELDWNSPDRAALKREIDAIGQLN